MDLQRQTVIAARLPFPVFTNPLLAVTDCPKHRFGKKAKGSSDGELESVWKNTWPAEDELPGDTRGHLGLAFLVADMVSSLKDAGAPQEEVNELNAKTLEILAGNHDDLISRSADLQSRIDELARLAATDGLDSDVPF